MNLQFEYFYGSEAEQFAFYRIPKSLMTDPQFAGVSLMAKLLYGLLPGRGCAQNHFPFDQFQPDESLRTGAQGALCICREGIPEAGDLLLYPL